MKMRELWSAREKTSEEKVRAAGVNVIKVDKAEFSAAMKPVYDKFVTDPKLKTCCSAHPGREVIRQLMRAGPRGPAFCKCARTSQQAQKDLGK